VMSASSFSIAPPVIAAGIGTALIAEIARRLGSGYAAFDGLLDVAPELRAAVCQCAPAAALAALAS
jgi:hypothetical protein